MKPVLFSTLLIFSMAAPAFAQKGDKSADFSDYGGKIGVGICILDGFGVPVRYYFSPKAVAEAGLYAGSIAIKDNTTNDEFEFHGGLQFGGGISLFGDRFEKSKRHKTKIRANGVALRANYLTGDYAAFRPSLSWAQETFREGRTNRSFIFELGIEGIMPNFKTYDADPTVNLHLRCHWNFFL